MNKNQKLEDLISQPILKKVKRGPEAPRRIPLFIAAKGRDNERKEKWKIRKICLRYGKKFRWKRHCTHCRYLIIFESRLK